MVDNIYPYWGAIPSQPDYRVLIDLEVLLYSQGNHRGIVTAISNDGWRSRVWMLSGDLCGQEIWTYTSDVAPIQPTEPLHKAGLVKLVSGPFVGRVGRLQDIVQTPGNTLRGVIEFGDGDVMAFDMSLIAIAHVPRAFGL